MAMQVEAASSLTQFGIFLVAVAMLASYVTYRDASNRAGANAGFWALAMGVGVLTVVGAAVVFAAYYLLVIREGEPRPDVT